MRLTRFLQSGLAMLLIWMAQAIPALAANEADPLFATSDVLDFSLHGPFNTIARDKDEAPQLRAGTLSVVGEGGEEQIYNVELEPRGKSRRDRAVCQFPPLWVHFDKEEVKGTLFKKQNKLKLVTTLVSSCVVPRRKTYTVVRFWPPRVL